MDLPISGDFEAYMKDYIRRHFAELLGEHTALLDEEGGLDALSALVRGRLLGEQAFQVS